jgi:hypothetical protein
MRSLYRNPDVRLRRLERRIAQGDVSAAEEALWYFARLGRWFLPPGWEPPGGSPPYASGVNDKRAYRIRLLGYLRWPGARELQETVATQAPERRPFEYGPGGLEWPSAPHRLWQEKPFSQIGPELAKDLGVGIMQVLAAACVRATFPLTDLEDHVLDDAFAAVLRYREASTAWRAALKSDRESTKERELRHKLRDERYGYMKKIEHSLWRMESFVRPDKYPPAESGALAEYHARTSLTEFLDAVSRHPMDQSSTYASSVFDSIYAEAFACDARKKRAPSRSAASRSLSSWGTPRPRRDWGDAYGARPSRSCTAWANRKLKQVMLGPALLAIASDLLDPIYEG